jgi:Zn-dependent protease with chaperone function
MSFLGADIRIVDISKTAVLELARSFIGVNKLHIERDEDLDTAVTHIRAVHPIDSYLKFWWKGTPQVIDWKIVELTADETQIETRFDFQRKYRIWFWGILIILSALFTNFYEASREDYLSAFVITLFVAFAIVLFVSKFCLVNFDVSLGHFWKTVREENTPYSEKILQSNSSFPDATKIIVFILAGFIVFATTHLELIDMLQSLLKSPAVILIFLVIICSTLAFFSARNPDVSPRLRFVILNLGLIASITAFYSLPYVFGYGGTVSGLYKQYASVEALLKDNQDSELSLLNQEIMGKLKKQLRIFALINFVGILMVAYLVVVVIGQASKVKDWRKEFFGSKKWTLSHIKIVDTQRFGREFSYGILMFWIGVSVCLYASMYMILSLLEFTILNKNLLFHTNMGQVFYNDTLVLISVVFAPLMSKPFADLFARLILVVYCMPLLWLIYKVLRKRLIVYSKNLRERNEFILDDATDSFGLRGSVGEIAQSFGVATPDIVMVPSGIPMLGTKYIGFPYFRSYVILSEGCLNCQKLKREALLGLLAHEIYHIKRHNCKWYALNLLSEYTIFGSGFLAVMVNSYQHELDADRYAAEWVKKRGPVSDYISGLETMNSAQGGLGTLKLTRSNGQTEEKDEGKKESFLKRLKSNLDLLFEIYFGEDILSYIHPPVEERIQRIRAMAGSQN